MWRWRPGQVVLKLRPNNGTDVRVTNTIGFGLEVTGTTNTGVTLRSTAFPGATRRSARLFPQANGSITYTAPAVVPTPQQCGQADHHQRRQPDGFDQPEHLGAESDSDSYLGQSPMSFNVGSASVVLTGQNFINGATVLMNGSPVSTTFNSGTQLTATLNPTQPGNLDLQVLNPSPGPATSADLIAHVAGGAPTLAVSPEDASRFLEQATFGATDADIHTSR